MYKGRLDPTSEAQRREGAYLRSQSELAEELGLRPSSLYSSSDHEASFGYIVKTFGNLRMHSSDHCGMTSSLFLFYFLLLLCLSANQ